MDMAAARNGSGDGGGSQSSPGWIAQVLSFLLNWTRRARPTLARVGFGTGSKVELAIGRRASELLEEGTRHVVWSFISNTYLSLATRS